MQGVQGWQDKSRVGPQVYARAALTDAHAALAHADAAGRAVRLGEKDARPRGGVARVGLPALPGRGARDAVARVWDWGLNDWGAVLNWHQSARVLQDQTRQRHVLHWGSKSRSKSPHLYLRGFGQAQAAARGSLPPTCAHAAQAGAPVAGRAVRLGSRDALPSGRVARDGLVAVPGKGAVDAGARVCGWQDGCWVCTESASVAVAGVTKLTQTLQAPARAARPCAVPPLHQPPWQTPKLQAVPSGWGGPGLHCPVEGSHEPGPVSHSPGTGHSTPLHGSMSVRGRRGMEGRGSAWLFARFANPVDSEFSEEVIFSLRLYVNRGLTQDWPGGSVIICRVCRAGPQSAWLLQGGPKSWGFRV